MQFSKKVLRFLIILLLNSICWAYEYQNSYTNDRVGTTAEQQIPIGLISDQYTNEMEIIFDSAIEVANEVLEVKLRPIKDVVNYGDSFQAYGKLCKMLEIGVGGIFGPSSQHTAGHLMSVCDAKDIPYFFSQMTENSEGFNLHPNSVDIAKALYAILQAFEWKRFIVLYESAEYLSILNGLLEQYGNNGTINISVLRYDLQLNDNYKPVLRRVRKSMDNLIVVMGSTDTMPEFLRQAQQVGIINEDYKYIIANPDFHAFDLEEYKYSEANITSIRMFSPEQPDVREIMIKLGYSYLEEDFRNGSCPITLKMALTYDAVQLFAETSKHLAFQRKAMNCSDRSDSVRDDGSTFKNYMRSMNISDRTITGRIYFEGNVRKGYIYDVIELQPSGIVKVGTWDETNNLIVQRVAQTNSFFNNYDDSLANKTFTILLSVPNKPYASIVETHKKLEGNSQYEGYSVDLINELAIRLGFAYTFKNSDEDYGSFNKTTNESTGMLREIIEGRADLVVTDLTMTAEREEAVDFTIPFMNLGIAILYTKPRKAPPNLFTFMDPFSSGVWWLVGLSFLCVSFSFFILGRLSPTEWDNPYPCVEEPTELKNQFTIGNSFWFTTGALLQQGSEIAPKALSVRTVAYIWWFFTLIMVSSYTANLAAFLTIETPTRSINSIEDLANNLDGVKYGAKKTGSTRNFFLVQSRTEGGEMYAKMNSYLEKHGDLLAASNQEGVNRVKNDNKYAFLMESTTIEYHTMRECKLKKVGNPLDEKGYGIAMRKNWPYRPKFNAAMLELQEQGVLEKMKNKWWKEVGAGICSSKSDQPDAAELNMKNLGGVYWVLVCGSAFSLLYGITGWILYVITKAKHYRVSLKDAFKEEIKFVLDFNASTRILKSSVSIYSHSRNSSLSIASIEPDTNTMES